MSLAADVVKTLAARQQLLGLAESCTGGLLAGAITSIPGSSSVLYLGHVTYSNEAKLQHLGIDPVTLNAFGAVSEEVVLEMAQGLLTRNPLLDWGIAITGIAGPSGGSIEKPVGLVYISVLQEGRVPRVIRNIYPGGRQAVRLQAVNHALELLLQQIKGN
ncbi:MAG: CinA family protein [Alphaproteobacteria bacterium]|nr:MAG: CinA family protein [Alphaproteobacteria bacterium]